MCSGKLRCQLSFPHAGARDLSDTVLIQAFFSVLTPTIPSSLLLLLLLLLLPPVTVTTATTTSSSRTDISATVSAALTALLVVSFVAIRCFGFLCSRCQSELALDPVRCYAPSCLVPVSSSGFENVLNFPNP